jgi:hypothetical protein
MEDVYHEIEHELVGKTVTRVFMNEHESVVAIMCSDNTVFKFEAVSMDDCGIIPCDPEIWTELTKER